MQSWTKKAKETFLCPPSPYIQYWRMREKDKKWTGKFLHTHHIYFNIE